MKNILQYVLWFGFVIVAGFAVGCLLAWGLLKAIEPSGTTTTQAYRGTAELMVVLPRSPDKKNICSAWNVAKIKDGYELATAAHCATFGDAFPLGNLEFYISYEDPDLSRKTLPATLVTFGDRSVNELNDIALFVVKTNDDLPVLELGQDNLDFGDKLFNVSAPFEGDVKGLFQGYVIQPDSFGCIGFVMPGIGQGSSGSALFSENQGRVVGLIVEQNRNTFLAIPVEFLKLYISEHPIKSANISITRPEPVPPEDSACPQDAFCIQLSGTTKK